LKALRTGLRIDTREIAFQCPSLIPNEQWQPLEILKAPLNLDSLQLFWKKLDNFLVTMAVISTQDTIEIIPDYFIQLEQ
jgi:hypothetical protein